MANKKIADKTLILSFDNFKKFTKVTNDNINDFIGNGSILIVCNIEKERLSLIHTFSSRKPFKAGLNDYYYIWDDTIVKYVFRCFKSEINSEYEDYTNDIKSYMKKEIKLNRIYGIKI